MYYIDGNSGFVVAADLSATSNSNPYLSILSIDNYVCTATFRCIFNVDWDIVTFYNPDTLKMTALNRGRVAYNSVSLLPYYSDTNFDSILSISHTLNQNEFIVTSFRSIWFVQTFYFVYYSSVQRRGYRYSSQMNVVLEPDRYRIEIMRADYVPGDGLRRFNYQVYSYISENRSTYNNVSFQRYAQKFTGLMRSQNRRMFMYSFAMDDVFQIQMHDLDSNLEIRVRDNGYIKCIDLTQDGRLLSYISSSGDLVVIAQTMGVFEEVDNHCSTAYLYFKNIDICSDLKAVLWIALALGILFPVFFIGCIVWICYERRKRRQQNQNRSPQTQEPPASNTLNNPQASRDDIARAEVQAPKQMELTL